MIEKQTKFKEDKEKSAVELLLDKINNMQEEIEFLKCHVQIYDYNMVRNAPNSVVRICTQPDALIVEYHDGRTQFIPIAVTQCMKHF